MLTVADIGWDTLRNLLRLYAIELHGVDDTAPIPGSYWGEPEAGLIGGSVYARADTPLHSLLHEACHLIVAPPARRALIHTNASDSQEEEDAACYLQICLAAELDGVGGAQLMRDMDTWGYSFRLGSAQVWFEHDAQDARQWLEQQALLPLRVAQ